MFSITFKTNNSLSLELFKKMDYSAIEKYKMPIELLMENAGLQLARLVTKSAKPNDKILIGVGNGNNGGGGLVAARRLSSWGYNVYLDTPVKIDKPLPLKQLNRALLVGVNKDSIKTPDIWIDAYLGFSQRLPLSQSISNSINNANKSDSKKISLDIPTGISEEKDSIMFMANQVMTLAAPKMILSFLDKDIELFLADIGLPMRIYKEFGTFYPPFHNDQLLKFSLK